MENLKHFKSSEKKLLGIFQADDYSDLLDFAYWIGSLAIKQNHHPKITIEYKRIVVEIWTFTSSKIEKQDIDMAKVIESYWDQL